jgi:hypothetical protein
MAPSRLFAQQRGLPTQRNPRTQYRLLFSSEQERVSLGWEHAERRPSSVSDIDHAPAGPGQADRDGLGGQDGVLGLLAGEE